MPDLICYFHYCKNILSLAFLGSLLTFSLSATPDYHPSKNPGGGNLRDTLYDFQHEIGNHEEELRIFEERINTQDNILDSLRQQVLDTNLANKELVKGNAASVETRMAGMESTMSGMISDLRQLQDHANDSAKALAQYKKKISELEKHIDDIQSAMNSLLEVLKQDSSSIPKSTYKVQSGDRLEKIARRHHTTVKKLKQVNGLKNDRIYIGQTLKIP